ncbi:MAG TPA: hypothetical protein VIU37_05745 [Candidatus Limnocylindrales bacterium]
MPREVFPAGIRRTIFHHSSIPTAASTVSADFNANTLQTIAGGAGGFIPGVKARITKLRFRVGDADFAGAGGTLTFELRRDSATGTAICSLTIPLASALRGTALEANVTNTNAAISAADITDSTKLFLVRLATGTVFTTGTGVFEVEAWERPQARQ